MTRGATSGYATVLLLGLPNTGKSRLFNLLSGEYSVVANYPLTTIEIQSAERRIDGTHYRFIDTPGMHCLYLHSEEELIVRDELIRQKPSVVVQCVDADRIRQSLHLTADLLDLGVPLVVVLNSIEESARNGTDLDVRALQRRLGVPVITSRDNAATRQRILAAVDRVAMEPASTRTSGIRYTKPIETATSEIEAALPIGTPYKRKAALLLLQNDPHLAESHEWLPDETDREALSEVVSQAQRKIRGNVNRAVNQSRSEWVQRIADDSTKKRRENRGVVLERIAQVCRMPVTGFPILIAILAIGFFLVVEVAGLIEGALASAVFGPLVGLLGDVLPAGWVTDVLIGQYGMLTLGLFAAIGTVLPILGVYFLLFGLLEDIGYLPNLAILVRRVLDRIGLSGKSVMPIILGFGCKTMATLTTRSVTSRKEKLIAVALIAFAIPCSAQLGLNMAVLGNAGVTALFIVLGFLVLVEVGAGAVLNAVIPDDTRTRFIQQLPPFRAPNIKALLTKTYFRLVWFLRESIHIFVIAAAALYLLDLLGVLDALKSALKPAIVDWLGLPLDMVDALILTMARHEIGAGYILRMSNAGLLDFTQSIVAVVITTMFVPCIANIVAMFRQLGTLPGIVVTLSINIVAFVLAGALHFGLDLLLGG
jgi:ferrous iron transport protein B